MAASRRHRNAPRAFTANAASKSAADVSASLGYVLTARPAQATRMCAAPPPNAASAASKGPRAGLVGDVGLHGHRARELGGERLGWPGAGGVADDDAGAERGQVDGDGAADAARRAGDDGHAAGEWQRRRLRLRRSGVRGHGDCALLINEASTLIVSHRVDLNRTREQLGSVMSDALAPISIYFFPFDL